MAGLIRYKLPGDRPRKPVHSKGVGGDAREWNPPPLAYPIELEPPRCEIGFWEAHRGVMVSGFGVLGSLSLTVGLATAMWWPLGRYGGWAYAVHAALGFAWLVAVIWFSARFAQYRQFEGLSEEPDLLEAE